MSRFTGRVTHLASGDLWGGAEAFVHALATEQQQARPGSVSCVVMNPGRLATALIDGGVATLVLNETKQTFRELLQALRSHIDAFAPQVLHAHRQKENLLALLGGWRKTANGSAIRRVTTVHGMPEPVRGANLLRSGVKHAINAAALHVGFDAVIGVSKDIATTLSPRFPNGRVVCIHNGVTIPPSEYQPPQAQRSALRLLALGRLVPVKRFDRLGGLSDALTESGLSRPDITLAGEGPLAAELRASLGAGEPGSGVHMPGFIADTTALLRNADALVMTSDHEGLPMGVLEALALGVPVFGFRVGGLPEIAAPALPLHLVAAGDVRALAASIVTYFTKHAPGTRTPPPPDWPFDIRFCARRYDELYDSILASRRAA